MQTLMAQQAGYSRALIQSGFKLMESSMCIWVQAQHL
jgi:AraC-like DNA-binding protein